ncbi:MAG TPA: rod-binding protein [Povalibacter sp.]|uniref:rod-binding protein n=1 Tax=Povalibacter sp. TaxID=1962978 RepID=UPI002C698647|nr:rod-binding protein [Povalibacter sp.]HMN43131.1 rod-binding protein [Povalibacter sp.]
MTRTNLDIALSSAPPSPAQPQIRAAADDIASADYVARVQAAAEKFEGFFIAQMLRQMRQSSREMAGEDSVFNSRNGQEMLDMADVALADSLAGRRAFGIADAIVRQLLPPPPPAAAGLKTSTAPVASSD